MGFDSVARSIGYQQNVCKLLTAGRQRRRELLRMHVRPRMSHLTPRLREEAGVSAPNRGVLCGPCERDSAAVGSARSARIGHSGRSSPWQWSARCSSVCTIACSSAILVFSPAAWESAIALTSALARSRSRHKTSSSAICSTEKPRSRARRIKRRL